VGWNPLKNGDKIHPRKIHSNNRSHSKQVKATGFPDLSNAPPKQTNKTTNFCKKLARSTELAEENDFQDSCVTHKTHQCKTLIFQRNMLKNTTSQKEKRKTFNIGTLFQPPSRLKQHPTVTVFNELFPQGVCTSD